MEKINHYNVNKAVLFNAQISSVHPP